MFEVTINIPQRRHWRRSGIFIVNFEHISHLVNFELINAGWVMTRFKYIITRSIKNTKI